MDFLAFQSHEDHEAWYEIFQIFSIERFIPLYPALGMPQQIIVNPSALINLSQQYVMSLSKKFAQEQVVDFEELKSDFYMTLSKLNESYGQSCIENFINWCYRYVINQDQVNRLFYWSLAIKSIVDCADGIDHTMISKVNGVFNLQKYELHQLEWQNQLHRVSMLTTTQWEEILEAQSHITEEDIFRDDFPDSLSPFLIGRLEMIDLISGYNFCYAGLKELESVLSIQEYAQFLDWARSLLDQEFPVERLVFPV
jgi:hypothetical protein